MKARTISQKLTTRLRVARIERDLGMRTLAAISGVSPASICRAEAGKEPSLAVALLLARALGYAVEELWELEPVAEKEGE